MNVEIKETAVCSNKHDCNCPKNDCKNHGRCCDCIVFHKTTEKLPFCIRQ